MFKNILMIQHNPSRYTYNTQMEKVIKYLRNNQNVFNLDISNTFNQSETFKKIIDFTKNKNIKFLLFIDGPPVLILPLSLMRSLQQNYVISIYYGDIFANFHSLYKYYAQCTDIALVDEIIETGTFQKYCPKVYFVPYAYENELKFKPTKNKDATLSFVGRDDRRNRKKYLSICKKIHPTKIFGVGSDIGPISDKKMKQVFNESLINLNFTGVQDYQPYVYAKPIDKISRSPKGRCQEIGMCGGFVLTEYAPGIEEMFSVGKEIDVFRSEFELEDKLKFYIQNPNIVYEMSKRHYNNCRKKLFYQECMGQMYKVHTKI